MRKWISLILLLMILLRQPPSQEVERSEELARYCLNCGKEFGPEDLYCSRCGHPRRG